MEKIVERLVQEYIHKENQKEPEAKIIASTSNEVKTILKLQIDLEFDAKWAFKGVRYLFRADQDNGKASSW